MSFLRGVKKRRIQFQVELMVVSLSDVPLLNAVIFAKVRLMECGTFEAYTSHRPVISYQVDFMKPANTDPLTSDLELSEECSAENSQPFQFQCRIPFDERTGELEECRCKISLRKEDRTGRAPQKLGFVVLNLSEFAASGTSGITQSFLLDGYSGGQRQDNSRVQCHIKMNHQAQDPLFKVPTTFLNAAEEEHLNPADRKAPSCTPTNTSSSADPKSKGASVNPASNTATSTENGETAGAEPVVTSRHNTLSSIIHSRFGSDHQHEEPRPTSCSTFSSAPSSGGCGVSSADRSSWHAGPSTYSSNLGISDQTSSHPQVGMRAADALPLTNSSVGHHHSARRMSEERLAMSLAGGGGTTNASLANRVQKTRRDAEDVIEEVLAETSALMESSSEYEEDMEGGGISGPGLALFISKDGTSTALGTHNSDKAVELDGSTRNGSDTTPHMANKGFERVTLNDTLR
uniref:C2 NT-type domain-containing protein n=1 Tax=Ditylenchus dipsaci TaxID=166011 RepID=A0A915CPE5_9BILA